MSGEDREPVADQERSEEKARLREIAAALLNAVREIGEYLAGLPAPDAEVRAWPLYADPEGGIFCGDPDCPLEAESSMLLDGGDDFTFAELHTAVGEHIATRREREAEQL